MLLAAGCTDDLGLNDVYFKCDSDADCGHDRPLCHPIAKVCAAEGETPPVSAAVDSGPATGGEDAGPTTGGEDAAATTGDPDFGGSDADCAHECGKLGDTQCSGATQAQECVDGPEGCRVWSEPSACGAAEHPECAEPACSDGSCGEVAIEGWCLIDASCVAKGTAAPDSGGCLKCDPDVQTGAWTQAEDGATCSSTECIVEQKCDAGTCKGDTKKNCDDGNICTENDCVLETGCTSTPVEGACEDGKPCTEADACAAGECLGGPEPTCDDSDDCTDDWCEAGFGCKHANNTAPCVDGDACTQEDSCLVGQCVGDPVVCKDDHECTVEDCNSDSGCLFIPTDGPCDDKNPCTDDTCDEASGCLHAPNTVTCNDSDACTEGDVCADSVCAGTAITCQDTDVCTDDTCEKATGCQFPFNTAPCNDDDACTDQDTCGAGTCAGSTITCEDDHECTTNGCDALTGCTFDPVDPECDDKNPCTDDSCSALTGCVHDDNTVDCNDLDACTKGDSCADAVCAGTTVVCTDNNVCTDDTCVKETGCAYPHNTLDCDDEDACTEQDVCGGSVCAGTTVDCNDNHECTADSCAKATGCVWTPSDAACNDNNVCTADACVVGTGCTHDPVSGDCDDLDPCTLEDQCTPTGGCAGTQKDCDDTDACTDDSCVGGDCVNDDVVCTDDGVACTAESCFLPSVSTKSCVQLGAAPEADGVCGVSVGCSGGVSYQAANLFCVAAGARLCTWQELNDAQANTAGCGYNDERVWTSTVCRSGSRLTQAGKPDKLGVEPLECTEETSAAFALCCADTEPGDVEPSCQSVPELAPCGDDKECHLVWCSPAAGCTETVEPTFCDDQDACLDDTCEADGSCSHVAKCAAILECSPYTEECYSCIDQAVNFDQPAFTHPNLSEDNAGCVGGHTQLVHDQLLVTTTGNVKLAACSNGLGDIADMHYLGVKSTDTGNVIITFPYPVDFISFDHRQFLNYASSDTTFSILNVESPQTFVLLQNKQLAHISLSFETPVTWIGFNSTGGAGIGTWLGLDNISYSGPSCAD